MAVGQGALEGLGMNPAFWKGKRVLLTGHTGFKGAWLTLWLHSLGARVTGYSLDPGTQPNLFSLAGVDKDCQDVRGDICDTEHLRRVFAESKPEIVLHLAAQALVRESYGHPEETWRVNVMGTLEVLEACRVSPSVKTVLVVTTDKVYENPERGEPFRETDPLGGYDPYSSSKAACEILCSSWRRSFLTDGAARVSLPVARAGNVIGGGDFAKDRLIPDLVRNWRAGQETSLRYPQAVRPWQHVLEPLGGYLLLAEKSYENPAAFSDAFNFGPSETDLHPVREVADLTCDLLGTKWKNESVSQPHEAGLLRLSVDRARERLGWRPRLSFEEAVTRTCDWYSAWRRGEDVRSLTLAQIGEFESSLASSNPSGRQPG
jgi:CDP-glucose 4,6-dehydratase